MNNYEIYIPPIRKDYNTKNGRFLKGHTPTNKGKKWSEYMPKRSQRRCRKGWINIVKYRPTKRPDVAGRCRKPVIAVTDDGKWCVLPFIGAAGKWCGGNRENVRRCCILNGKHLKNTDHKYKGVRWYYESDNNWTTKIAQ